MASNAAAEALAVACAFVENYYIRFASGCQLLMPMYSPEARLCLGGSASPAKPTTFEGRASIARHLEALDQQMGVRKIAITSVDAVLTPNGSVVVTADGKVLTPSCDRTFSHVFYLTPVGVNQYCISAEVLRFQDETKYDNGFGPAGLAPLPSAAPQGLTPSPLSPSYVATLPQPAPIVPLGAPTPYPARSQLNSAAAPFTRPLGPPHPAVEALAPKPAPQPPAPVVTTPPKDSAVLSYQRANPVPPAVQAAPLLPAAPARVFEEPDEDERRKTPPPAVSTTAKKDEPIAPSDADKRRGNRANEPPRREKPSVDAEKNRAKEAEAIASPRPASAAKAEKEAKREEKSKPQTSEAKKPSAAREDAGSQKETRNGDAAATATGRAGREKGRNEERGQAARESQPNGRERSEGQSRPAAAAPAQKANKQVVLFNVPTDASTGDVEYYAEAFGAVADVEWMGSRHAIVTFKHAGDAQAMLDYENFTMFHKPVRRAAYVEKERRADAPTGEETERHRGDRREPNRNGERGTEKPTATKSNEPKQVPVKTEKPSVEEKPSRKPERSEAAGKGPSSDRSQRAAPQPSSEQTTAADNGAGDQKEGSSRNRRRR